jgi:hypothetical protein
MIEKAKIINVRDWITKLPRHIVILRTWKQNFMSINRPSLVVYYMKRNKNNPSKKLGGQKMDLDTFIMELQKIQKNNGNCSIGIVEFTPFKPFTEKEEPRVVQSPVNPIERVQFVNGANGANGIVIIRTGELKT